MTDIPDPSPSAGNSSPEFRWQSLFRRSDDCLFLLSRRRRILFVNPAWEALTGVVVAEARGLVCSRNTPGSGTEAETVASTLCPPSEVMNGLPRRCRRVLSLQSGPRTWDIDYFPLSKDGSLLGVLGVVRPVSTSAVSVAPLPDKLLSLRSPLVGRYSLEQVPCKSPAWHLVAGQVRLASRSLAPVLILGEAGAGKHWLARAIHFGDSTRHGPFVKVDCGKLPVPALEKLLSPGGGFVRRVERGTIYLAQCQRLPRDLQHHVLSWINGQAETSARFMASCHDDPAAEVSAGRILGDLYCALAAFTIHAPPLRQRLPDLPALVENFMPRAMPPGSAQPPALAPAVMEVFASYAWPGNLSELLTVLRAAAAQANGAAIELVHIPAYLRSAMTIQRASPRETPRPLRLDTVLEQVERRLILQALQQAQGNKSKAADLLGVWRPRLLRRMQALGIVDADSANSAQQDSPANNLTDSTSPAPPSP
jgi:transcriptional regulator with PAS, ATPase and Fis domain